MMLRIVVLGLALSTALAGSVLADGPTDPLVATVLDGAAQQQQQLEAFAGVLTGSSEALVGTLEDDAAAAGPLLGLLTGSAPDILAQLGEEDPAALPASALQQLNDRVAGAGEAQAECFQAYADLTAAFVTEQTGIGTEPLAASAVAQCQAAQGFASDPAANAQALVGTLSVPLPPL